jgi:hypothetical protein
MHPQMISMCVVSLQHKKCYYLKTSLNLCFYTYPNIQIHWNKIIWLHKTHKNKGNKHTLIFVVTCPFRITTLITQQSESALRRCSSKRFSKKWFFLGHLIFEIPQYGQMRNNERTLFCGSFLWTHVHQIIYFKWTFQSTFLVNFSSQLLYANQNNERSEEHIDKLTSLWINKN